MIRILIILVALVGCGSANDEVGETTVTEGVVLVEARLSPDFYGPVDVGARPVVDHCRDTGEGVVYCAVIVSEFLVTDGQLCSATVLASVGGCIVDATAYDLGEEGYLLASWLE